MNIRRTAAALTSAAALTVTGVAMATPAAASSHNNVAQEGLVNLALQDTNVQVPIGIAANICGVTANVLASQSLTAPVECTADGVATAERERGGPNNARQNGLVNVAVQDTNVQVPVAVAANVCGVTVNALSSLNLTGPTDCEAIADAIATG